MYWFRETAEQGDANAQFSLGLSYCNGKGVTQDYGQAVYWYQKAAEQGHADAQYNLGLSYYNGQGVMQDDKQAVYWFRKAAEQGDPDAKEQLDEVLKKLNEQKKSRGFLSRFFS